MIREEVRNLVKEAILDLQKKDKLSAFDLPEINVDYPPEGFGNYTTNIAIILAKLIKKSPQELANLMRNELKNNFIFEKIEIAPQGFINFFISNKTLYLELQKILKGKNLDFKKKKEKINLEFISANPTGPLTIGNGRGGTFGDVLGNILRATGLQVTKEYYVNDAGVQIKVLGHSVIGDAEAIYSGDYITELRKKIKGKNPIIIGEKAALLILKDIKNTTKSGMGIKMDVWFSEKSLYKKGKVENIIKLLREKNLVYEKDGALWFRSFNFGDEKDRVIVKSDGEKTYLAGDFAYHANKFIERKFDKAINIWGADHHGDVARLKAAAEVLGYKNKLEIILMQMVRVIKNGKEIRMSKRKGVYFTIDALLKEVGSDVFRFFFLMYAPDTHMNFDLDLAKERSVKNPVFYVQYAYARACSVLRKTKDKKFQTKSVNLNLLTHPSELDLILELIKLPEIIEDISKNYQVQRLPQYAIKIADTFHKFYESVRVLTDDKKVTLARLHLVFAMQKVLAQTFHLLGINAPKKM